MELDLSLIYVVGILGKGAISVGENQQIMWPKFLEVVHMHKVLRDLIHVQQVLGNQALLQLQPQAKLSSHDYSG
jgi:hypothetical protein